MESRELTWRAPLQQTPPFRVRGTHRFAVADLTKNQLAFAKGDVLTVIELHGNWFLAEDHTGASGLIPKNYIELLPATDNLDNGVSNATTNAVVQVEPSLENADESQAEDPIIGSTQHKSAQEVSSLDALNDVDGAKVTESTADLNALEALEALGNDSDGGGDSMKPTEATSVLENGDISTSESDVEVVVVLDASAGKDAVSDSVGDAFAKSESGVVETLLVVDEPNLLSGGADPPGEVGKLVLADEDAEASNETDGINALRLVATSSDRAAVVEDSLLGDLDDLENLSFGNSLSDGASSDDDTSVPPGGRSLGPSPSTLALLSGLGGHDASDNFRMYFRDAI